MRSNKSVFRAVLGAVLAANMMLPLAAAAQNANRPANVNRPANGGGFCAQLASQTANVEARLADAKSRSAAKRAESEGRLEERRKSRGEKIEDLRGKEDDKRTGRIAELEPQADTGEKQLAIQRFRTAVAAAVEARRAATDAANEAFRTGLKDLIASRKAAADAALKTFDDTVSAALAKAKADCAAGAASSTVRVDLLAAMKSAREKLQTDLRAVAKLGEQAEPLIETRKEAHRKAKDDFKTALEKAKADLKAAFGAE